MNPNPGFDIDKDIPKFLRGYYFKQTYFHSLFHYTYTVQQIFGKYRGGRTTKIDYWSVAIHKGWESPSVECRHGNRGQL